MDSRELLQTFSILNLAVEQKGEMVAKLLGGGPAETRPLLRIRSRASRKRKNGSKFETINDLHLPFRSPITFLQVVLIVSLLAKEKNREKVFCK